MIRCDKGRVWGDSQQFRLIFIPRLDGDFLHLQFANRMNKRARQPCIGNERAVVIHPE